MKKPVNIYAALLCVMVCTFLGVGVVPFLTATLEPLYMAAALAVLVTLVPGSALASYYFFARAFSHPRKPAPPRQEPACH